MSLEKIDRYISELEAIKYYEQVKRERDETRRELDGLKKSLDLYRGRVASLETLKATTDGKTLAEAEKAILLAKEGEIVKRANEQFASFKAA